MLDNNTINKIRDAYSEKRNDARIRRELAYQYGKDLYDQTLTLFVQAIDEFVALAPTYGLGVTTNAAGASHPNAAAASHPNPIVIPCSKEEYKAIGRRLGLLATRDLKAWYWFDRLPRKKEDALSDGTAVLPPVFEGTSLERHLKKNRRKEAQKEAQKEALENRELLKSFGSACYPLLNSGALQVSEKGVLRAISASSARIWPGPEEYFRDNFHASLNNNFSDAPTGILLEHSDTQTRYGGDPRAPLTPEEFERDIIKQSQMLLADSRNTIKRICESALAGVPSSSFHGFGERIVVYSQHVT